MYLLHPAPHGIYVSKSDGLRYMAFELPHDTVFPEGSTPHTVEDLTDFDPWVEPVVTPSVESPLDKFNRMLAAGFDTGLGFRLALGDADRGQFTQMLVLVQVAMSLGVVDYDAPQTIADQDGVTHEVTTEQFIGLMLQYGMYYKGLWDALKAGNL